ncbi:MAG: CDP-alcohol phosphatidyltransferase family protein [Candidatus Melainabacteria bacterium]
MASIYDFKPAFQRSLQPVMNRLHGWGIHPNQVTLWAIILSVTGGLLLLLAQEDRALLLTIPAILFVRMALNALDGMLARQTGQSTPWGAVLNELGDVVSDIALYLPLLVWTPGGLWMKLPVMAFVLLSLLSEFCGLLAQVLIGHRRYDGPMGKSDRAFLVGTVCLLMAGFPEIQRTLPLILSVADVMLISSCINRIRPIVRQSELSEGLQKP